MKITPVPPVSGLGVYSSSASFHQPASQQLAVGLQASGVRQPAATLDISQKAREAAETAAAARVAETVVSPGEEISHSQLPAEMKRRNPFVAKDRQRRHKLDITV